MKINVRINKPKKVNILLSKKSAFISFDYNEKLKDFIKNFSYRNYDPTTREWEILESDLKTLIEVWSKYAKIDIVDETPEEIPHIEKTIPKDYKFYVKPMQHQLEAINFGLNHPNFILADEMGLGKSFSAAHISNIESKSKILIICCGCSLKENWKEDLKKNLNEDAFILTGSNKDKLNQLENINTINEKYIITNLETLRGLSYKEKLEGRKREKLRLPIAEKLKELCDNKTIYTIIVDEFHRGAKDIDSQNAQGLLMLNSKYKIGLSGTPILNKPFDLLTILTWLGYNSMNKWQFEHHFGIWGGYGNHQLMAYKNLDELKTLLDSVMLRRLKSECLNLPDKIYVKEYIEMDEDQQKLYDGIRDGIIQELNKIMFSPDPLSKLVHLKQTTLCPWIFEKDISCKKLERLKELVEDIVANNQKVIIFSEWTQVTKILKEELKKYNPAYITGEITKGRQKEVNKFQEDESCKVFIGTIGAAGTGLTLTAATNIIFYDKGWTPAIVTQSEDRAMRIGQKNNVTIYSLITKNTIEENIENILYKKGQIADYMIDDKVKKVDMKLIKSLLSVEEGEKLSKKKKRG